MALEAVEAVERAEEKARETIAAAQNDAKTILSEAERAGRAALDAARIQAQAETEQTLAAAKIKGEAAGEAVLMGAKREAANLVADAKSRMDAAAAGIVAKIKGGEGD